MKNALLVLSTTILFFIFILSLTGSVYGQEQEFEVTIDNSSIIHITNYTAYYYRDMFIVSGEMQNISDEPVYGRMVITLYDEQGRIIGDGSDLSNPNVMLSQGNGTFVIKLSNSDMVDTNAIKKIRLAPSVY